MPSLIKTQIEIYKHLYTNIYVVMRAGNYERGEREGNRIYVTGKLTERTYLGKNGHQQSEKSGGEGGLYVNSNDIIHENVNEIHYFVY